MEYKDIIEIAESLRRQARKAVNKFQTDLDSDSGLVDAIRNLGEGAIYGKIMLQHLEVIFDILNADEGTTAEGNIEQHLSERAEFLTGMKPWVPNSTDAMSKLINSITANVLADLIEAFKE